MKRIVFLLLAMLAVAPQCFGANIVTTEAAIAPTAAKLYGQTDAGVPGWVDSDAYLRNNADHDTTSGVGIMLNGAAAVNTGVDGVSLKLGRAAATPSLYARTKSGAGISGLTFVDQFFSYSTNANALEIYTTGAKSLVFGTAGTERMRITGAGAFELSSDFGFGTGSHYAKFYINDVRTTIDRHGYEDQAALNTTDTGLGYSSFDAKTTLTNPNNQDHLVGYQARNIYNGSANLTSRFVGFHSFPTTTGTGNIVNNYGIKLDDMTGTGTVTNNYGIYIGNTIKGSTLNYAIYSAGGTNKFVGDVVLATKTPASASATGVAGTIAWDANYIYICTATDTWKRVAIATW